MNRMKTPLKRDEEKKNFLNQIQGLSDELDQYKRSNDNLQAKNNDLVNKYTHERHQHQIAIQKLTNEIKTTKEQHSKNLQQLRSQINDINNINQQCQGKNEAQERKIIQLQVSLESKDKKVQNVEKEKGNLYAENDSLRQKNTNLEKQLEEITQQNAVLADEASNYQSALGVATNFQLGDDDQNHAVKLNNDISALIDNLKSYITNLKQDIVVNMNKVQELLILYNCPNKITNQKNDRLLIQAVLQRHVIETVFSYAKRYFDHSGKHYFLEADIMKNESSLSELLAYTSKCRIGNDEVSRVGPTKLRQQIYSILSNRGFADVFEEDAATYEHPFVAYNKTQLNKIMNELRIIDDGQKKTATEELAGTIIREIVKIFWFRLKVQEPVVQYTWIPYNAEVDKTYMEGGNFDDDVNLYVDLCHFPLIGRDLTSNNRKIYTPAKVFARKNQVQNGNKIPTGRYSSKYI